MQSLAYSRVFWPSMFLASYWRFSLLFASAQRTKRVVFPGNENIQFDEGKPDANLQQVKILYDLFPTERSDGVCGHSLVLIRLLTPSALVCIEEAEA